MSFIKFGEWVSLREEVAQTPAGAMVPKPAGPKKNNNPKTKKIIGNAAKSGGNPEAAIDMAVNDPSLDGNDVTDVANAVRGLKKN